MRSKNCLLAVLSLTGCMGLAGTAPVFEYGSEDQIAGQELHEHLEQMYASLSTSPFAGKHIRLGKKAGPVDAGKTGPEGFRIVCRNGNLDIAGSTVQGTLNGVYHFLEEVMGVRWLTPQTTYLPENPKVRLEGLDFYYQPIFRRRLLFNIFAGDATWGRRQRLKHHLEQENYGIPQGHNTFYFLCRGLEKETGRKYTPEQAFKEFPQYFAEYVDHRGNRKRPFTFSQLCYSNPDVKRLVARGMLAALDKYPKMDFMDLSRMDGPDPCECALCEAEYVKRGKKSNTKSDAWFTFFRDVAKEVHKKYPDLLIGSYAYHTTQIPPDVNLGPNTCVRYCPIRMNYFCRVDEGDHNRIGGLLDDYAPGLSNIAGQLAEWPKHTQLWLSLTIMKNPVYYPNPHLRPLGYNMAYAARVGANSIFVEDLNWLPSHAQCKVRSYILAKLLWNPYYDVDKGIREFCSLYFGAAGDSVVEYLKLLHDENSWNYKSDRKKWLDWRFRFYNQWVKKRIIGSTWKWFYEKPDPALYYKKRFPFSRWGTHCPLTEQFCLDALKCLKQGAAKVSNDPVMTERIKTEMLPVYFASMLTLPKNHPQTQEAIREFFPAIERIIAADPRLRNNPKKAEALIHHGALKKYLEKAK